MKSVAQFTIAFIVVSLLSYRTGHTVATVQAIKQYGDIRQQDLKRHEKEMMEVIDITISAMSNAVTRQITSITNWSK